MPTVTVTADTFDEILAKRDIVLLDFFADWCGPCHTFAPIYEQAATKHSDLLFGKVDADVEPQLTAAFQIRSIPTLAILRDGMLVFSQPGVLPAEALDDLISQVRNLDMDEVHAKLAAQTA